MTIFGITRVKNESRWIKAVLEAAATVCERVFVLDDHSTDGTPDLCESLGDYVTVIRSQRDGGLDEAIDKDQLLQRAMGCVSDVHLRGNERSPYWALAFDGDEILDEDAFVELPAVLSDTDRHAFKLRIPYLWDSDLSLIGKEGYRRVRVDGVYGRFARPSVFRLMNGAFRFQRTPRGGNLHCSSIPQELLHHALSAPVLDTKLWHTGYNDRADRVRKYAWYNQVDPNNRAEDCYRHMVQGDLPEVPADMRLLHAGPFQVVMM